MDCSHLENFHWKGNSTILFYFWSYLAFVRCRHILTCTFLLQPTFTLRYVFTLEEFQNDFAHKRHAKRRKRGVGGAVPLTRSMKGTTCRLDGLHFQVIITTASLLVRCSHVIKPFILFKRMLLTEIVGEKAVISALIIKSLFVKVHKLK